MPAAVAAKLQLFPGILDRFSTRWAAQGFVLGLEGTISGLDNGGDVLNNVFGAGLDDRFSWRTN